MLYRYRATERPYSFPQHGYAGAAILLAAEALLFARVEPVSTYFTAIAWTGYILWADAAVYSIRGRSLLKTCRLEFVWMALCSIPLWLIFEAYNLRLANWVYVGLPENWLARNVGYAWAFATIWPAIFETATFLRALTPRNSHAATGHVRNAPPPTQAAASTVALAGAFLLIAPLLAPQRLSSYLFGAVWLGFIFFLEPINYWLGGQSLWRDLRQGFPSRLLSLFGSGLICGIFWEFWNHWATARWVYTVPILPEWKIFAMPVLGYLGFPPFAVECFVLFAFIALLINSILRKLGWSRNRTWEALQL